MAGREAAGYRPPYKRIEADLRRKIYRRDWSPGMILPSRRELAQAYQVSLGTIERAVSDLLSDGTLTSRDRRGTFVSENAPAATHEGAAVDNVVWSAGEGYPPATTATIAVICPLEPRMNEAEWIIGWPNCVIQSVQSRIAGLGGRALFSKAEQTLLVAPVDINESIASYLDQGVDGFVFVMLKDDDLDDVATRFAVGALNLPPAVFVMVQPRLIPATSIHYDSRDAGFHAARHLLDQGCRSITFFAPYESDFGRLRLEGIHEAVSLAGLEPECVRSAVKPVPVEDLYNAVNVERNLRWLDQKIAGFVWAREVLAGGFATDGVVVVNDEVGLGFAHAAREFGLNAGSDFAIVGFDDSPEGRSFGLSTMRPPLELMGEEAARLIMDAVGGKRTGQRVALHSQLIERASSRLARRG
jgi:DNA-binding LacI/PurR family transcriptional regulator